VSSAGGRVWTGGVVVVREVAGVPAVGEGDTGDRQRGGDRISADVHVDRVPVAGVALSGLLGNDAVDVEGSIAGGRRGRGRPGRERGDGEEGCKSKVPGQSQQTFLSLDELPLLRAARQRRR